MLIGSVPGGCGCEYLVYKPLNQQTDLSPFHFFRLSKLLSKSFCMIIISEIITVFLCKKSGNHPGFLLKEGKKSWGNPLKKYQIRPRRTKWLYLNVKNVEQQRKADANPKSVLNVLQQGPC